MAQSVEQDIDIWGQSLREGGGLACAEMDAEAVLRAGRYARLPIYSFGLVLQGSYTLTLGGRELTVHPRDLVTYTPGIAYTVEAVSADYRALNLVVDEAFAAEAPVVRDMIRTAYFPIVELSEPRLTLSEEEADRLCRQLRDIELRLQADHLYKADVLRLLYATFLLDLRHIQHRAERRHLSSRAEELFIGFLRLLPSHFVEHRDIAFYADQLCVTPVYLSRIVRQVSGRTVLYYINQMLLMEAAYLLRNSSLTTTQIAEQLHFASQASFSRFFTRLKGVAPSDYRRRR